MLGVYRILVLAVIEGIKERYENLRVIQEVLHVSECPVKLAADLLMINAQLGISVSYCYLGTK